MMTTRDDFIAVERTPESEKFLTVGHKSDAEILALMRALGVCQRCANSAMALARSAQSEALPSVPSDEAIGFPLCSKACGDGIMAALTMQQH